MSVYDKEFTVRFHFPYATVTAKATAKEVDLWQAALQNLVVFRVTSEYNGTIIINPNLVTYIEVNESVAFA